MWLAHCVITLLLRLPTVYSDVAPTSAPTGRQLSHPEDSTLRAHPLAVRIPPGQAAPSGAGPSTLSTFISTSTSTSAPGTVHEVSPLTALPPPSTPLPPPLPPSSSRILPSLPFHSGSRNHNVAVAQNGSTFTPSTLRNIPIGDTLTFYFYPSNFSIVQSSFDKPCQPLSLSSGGPSERGIFSGFHPTENAQGISREKFVVIVTQTDPIWIYGVDGASLAATAGERKECACAKGMSLVVNPPPKDFGGAGETLTTYRRNAANEELNGSGVGGNASRVPESIEGGEVRGVSEKEKQRWEARHPLGGTTVRVNGTSVDGKGDGVAGFESGGVLIRRSKNVVELLGFSVLILSCVSGLVL